MYPRVFVILRALRRVNEQKRVDGRRARGDSSSVRKAMRSGRGSCMSSPGGGQCQQHNLDPTSTRLYQQSSVAPFGGSKSSPRVSFRD